MGKRMTREEFLEAVFSRRYEELKGRELRTVRVRVVGKELSLAQLIGVTDRRVYENLGLHIGTHLGEDHTGQSIGLLHLTPWEATVVAADVAMKSGNVELGFLDRFSGAVILLGCRRGVLPLVGVVSRIEAVGAEIAVLPPGLQVEEPGPSTVAGRTHESVVIREIGVVPVAVAAAVGGRPEH